ncbi:MAG: tRNA-dihydrouridine synthase family protein [Clostridia bacterium]|nr:tRNA-dihydrouridine synthase family protein [Clostridia bacterium]
MNPPVYFAPLEGMTDAVFRRTHHALFPGVAKYFIPFISPTQNLRFTARDLAAVSPEHNAGLFVVPQILTKNADHFLWCARSLCDMGYGEVNLNLGCPSGTVTAKGKGSGMLMDLFALERFLDCVFARTPVPVSVKTRIGYSDPDEFGELLSLFSRYPVCELIIHPRTRAEFYRGTPHREIYAAALEQTALPVAYNGDLFTAQDCLALMSACPNTRALMLGRGLIANPALARELAGGPGLTLSDLRAYHDRLLEAYLTAYPVHIALGRMREIMKHVVCCFDGAQKPRKAIRKAVSLAAYEQAVQNLFEGCALRETPGFGPEE